MINSFFDLDIRPIDGCTFSAIQFANRGLEIKKAIEAWHEKNGFTTYIRETGVCDSLEVRTRLDYHYAVALIVNFFEKLLAENPQ